MTDPHLIVKQPALLKKKSSIYTYLQPQFEERLRGFLETFEQVRLKEGKRIRDVETLQALPFSMDTPEWKLRQKSLAIVLAALKGEKELMVLEIGGWNGWLSKEIAARGHKLISIDYFTDEMDGLLAKNHHAGEWTAIQCDLNEPDIFTAKFDLVILNHGLPYFTDPAGYAVKIAGMKKPGGKVLMLGIPFFRNAARKKKELEKMKQHYLQSYRLPIFIHDIKGALEPGDEQKMKVAGYSFHHYPGMWKQKLWSFISPYHPSIKWGLHE